MKSQKWMLDIEKYIGVNDNIRESYDGWLNNEYVYMLFTDKKIIVVEEPNGGVEKTRILLNLPYNRIKTLTVEKPDIIFSIGISFTDNSDFKRVFVSENESAQVIEKKLRELIQRSVPIMLTSHNPNS